MAKTTLRVEVTHDDSISPDDVCTAVSKMIDVGQADASDSNEDPELAGEDTAIAASLEIGVFAVV